MRCRVRVEAPRGSWLRGFSERHPELHIEVVDRIELDAGATLFEVRLPEPPAAGWGPTLRRQPGVYEVESLGREEGVERLRVFFRGPTFVPMLRGLGLIRSLPFTVEAGVQAWTVRGPAVKIRKLAERLGSRPERFHLEELRPQSTSDDTTLLTRRQREILHAAVVAGYFDVPRRISLTALARKLGVAPSTVSVSLAHSERKLIAVPSTDRARARPGPRSNLT
jgi:hypothetical protein